jgi:uroporphyrinogen-III decarboxylase
MTERERFIETLLFGRPDRIPLMPGGPRESTLAAWHRQGLPERISYFDHLLETLGIERPPAIDRIHPKANFRMIPQFEEKVVERRQRTLIVQDWKGNICEISNQYGVRHLRDAVDFVTRTWIKCPVQTREDWEDMKRRYDPDEPARFEQDFEEKCARVRRRQHVVTVGFAGPFWQLREWCGFEGLCILFIDDPQRVHEMVDFWRDFVSAVLEKLLRHLVPDCVHISEDMAYKEKSMISPAMVREFLLPCWSQWCRQVRSAGVPLIDMDSDGYVGELIPLWIEAGVNVCDPIEVAAGNDIVEYRRQFGRKMAFRQGVDKRAIAKGGRVIRAEMERVRPVVRDGGYIPGCDHGVPPDISWPTFVEYTRILAEMTGWLQPLGPDIE